MRLPFARASRLETRRGLTLMELVVVLVILIAVASILLPMLPMLLTKTHDAVTTTNIGEVDKSISGYLGQPELSRLFRLIGRFIRQDVRGDAL